MAEYAILTEVAQRTGARIFFADEAHFRADAELRGKWVLKGKPASGGFDQPAVWGEGQLLFGGVPGDGRGGMDGTGGQQQLRDLGGLLGPVEEGARWTAECDLGQCPGAPWRGGGGLSAPVLSLPKGTPGLGLGERGGHWKSVSGDQGLGAGEGRQLPGRTGQPEKRGEAPLPDGPAVKGRSTLAKFPARFPASGECTSHLGFCLVLQRRFLNLVSFWPEIASRKARPPPSCQARGQVSIKRCSRSLL